jgi:hypothetical protein
MPTKKFLELDSNYRNRNINPNPGQFDVSISQSGLRSQSSALDPVTYAYPEIVFCPTDILAFVGEVDPNIQPPPPPRPLPPFTTTPLALSYSIPTGNDDSTFLLASSSSTVLILQNLYNESNYIKIPTTDGYMVGLCLQIDLGDNRQIRRIVGWKYLQEDIEEDIQVFQCTIESPFLPTTETFAIPLADCTLIIINPTDVHSDPANSYVFIPGTLSVAELYTSNYMLYNINRHNFTDVLSFDMDTHLAKVDVSNFVEVDEEWQETDRFVLRREVPRSYGNTNNPFDLALPFIIEANNVINFGTDWTWDDSYLNNFIAVYYTPVTLEPAPPDNFPRLPTAVAPIILQITGFLYDPPINPEQFPPAPPIYTRRAYFKTLPSVDIYDIVEDGLFPNDTYFEILPFNIDNVSPFVYTGTMSSQSQAVAQEVALNSLILPNVNLSNGGRIAYYPYVYVELENTSSSSGGTKNLIYSNNPHTYKAVFKVPITDLNHPTQSPFVKLTGNGMEQTIIFKQNDDMRLSIRLPNGTLFEPNSSDYLFGRLPNPRLQVSALFSMEKIS